jgi:hypothetical protein
MGKLTVKCFFYLKMDGLGFFLPNRPLALLQYFFRIVKKNSEPFSVSVVFCFEKEGPGRPIGIHRTQRGAVDALLEVYRPPHRQARGGGGGRGEPWVQESRRTAAV